MTRWQYYTLISTSWRKLWPQTQCTSYSFSLWSTQHLDEHNHLFTFTFASTIEVKQGDTEAWRSWVQRGMVPVRRSGPFLCKICMFGVGPRQCAILDEIFMVFLSISNVHMFLSLFSIHYSIQLKCLTNYNIFKIQYKSSP